MKLESPISQADNTHKSDGATKTDLNIFQRLYHKVKSLFAALMAHHRMQQLQAFLSRIDPRQFFKRKDNDPKKMDLSADNPIWDIKNSWIQKYVSHFQEPEPFSPPPDLSQPVINLISLMNKQTKLLQSVLDDLGHDTEQTAQFQTLSSSLDPKDTDFSTLCENAGACARKAIYILEEMQETHTSESKVITDLLHVFSWLDNISDELYYSVRLRHMLVSTQGSRIELPHVNINVNDIRAFKQKSFLPMVNRMIASEHNTIAALNAHEDYAGFDYQIRNLLDIPLSPGSPPIDKERKEKAHSKHKHRISQIKEEKTARFEYQDELIGLQTLFTQKKINSLFADMQRHNPSLSTTDINTRIVDSISNNIIKVCSAIAEQASSEERARIPDLQQQLIQEAADVLTTMPQ